jgi:dTDP-4-dehydrorhamnose 3,5-epimerase-like enzyme
MVRVLPLERFQDERGALVPLTFDDLGFSVVRTFVVTAPRGAVRGGHAHLTVRQVLLRVSGTIEVEVVHAGAGSAYVTLDDSAPAVLIEPGVWAQQTYSDDNAALVVFADGHYDSDEYSHVRPGSVGSSGTSGAPGSTS